MGAIPPRSRGAHGDSRTLPFPAGLSPPVTTSNGRATAQRSGGLLRARADEAGIPAAAWHGGDDGPLHGAVWTSTGGAGASGDSCANRRAGWKGTLPIRSVAGPTDRIIGR